MKKSFALLIVSLLVFTMMAFSACSSPAPAPAPAPTPAPAPAANPEPAAEPEVPAYPTKEITIICPWAAGSGTDTNCRILAKYASEVWGVPVNIINEVGGHGIPGVQSFVTAEPDGYTLGASSQADAQVMYAIYGDSLPFTKENRTYIVQVAELALIAAVSVDSEIYTIDELIEYAKTNPSFRWSGGSVSGLSGFAAAGLLHEAGVPNINETRINYSGGGSEATAAVAGGHLTTYFISQSEYKTHCLGDKPLLRGLAVTGSRRVGSIPDLPSTSEFGYKTDVWGWNGITGPAGIPDYVIAAWEKLVEDGAEELKARYAEAGVDFAYRNHADLTAFGDQMYEDVKRMIEEIGLKFDV